MYEGVWTNKWNLQLTSPSPGKGEHNNRGWDILNIVAGQVLEQQKLKFVMIGIRIVTVDRSVGLEEVLRNFLERFISWWHFSSEHEGLKHTGPEPKGRF